jgi:hypothetical protein
VYRCVGMCVCRGGGGDRRRNLTLQVGAWGNLQHLGGHGWQNPQRGDLRNMVLVEYANTTMGGTGWVEDGTEEKVGR